MVDEFIRGILYTVSRAIVSKTYSQGARAQRAYYYIIQHQPPMRRCRKPMATGAAAHELLKEVVARRVGRKHPPLQRGDESPAPRRTPPAAPLHSRDHDRRPRRPLLAFRCQSDDFEVRQARRCCLPRRTLRRRPPSAAGHRRANHLTHLFVVLLILILDASSSYSSSSASSSSASWSRSSSSSFSPTPPRW